jgi:acetoin utilization deacetylase AcuC-like enzyme
MREIGFPWSDAMVERARRMVGATVAACCLTYREGIAANLGGGTHHSLTCSPPTDGLIELMAAP